MNHDFNQNERDRSKREGRDSVLNRIEVIPAFRRPEALAPGHKRKRVAAYCRVSTGSIEQESSIENQREHYEARIASRPEWIPAGVYWEAGVTGTKQEARPELKRMMDDCAKGRIDLILTKSISRFSRNTTDCLELVRKLNDLSVQILFEKENICTGTAESELMLTLFASMAEAESHSISANLTWAIEKRFQSGTYRFSKAPFGYRLEDGNLIVDPVASETVREIYRMVLNGEGTHRIAKELNLRQIPTGTFRRDKTPGRWTPLMVQGILTNVIYTGDVLMQKTFHDRHFRCRPNRGEKPKYYMEEHHAPIIGWQSFELAVNSSRQRGAEKGVQLKDLSDLGFGEPDTVRHSAGDKKIAADGNVCVPTLLLLKNADDRDTGGNPSDSNPGCETRRLRHCLSGKMICGCCGAPMRRVTQRISAGTRHHWSCLNHLEGSEICGMKRIAERDVMHSFMTMMNKLCFGEEAVLETYAFGFRRDCGNKNAAQIRELEEKGLQCVKERIRMRELLARGRGDAHRYSLRIMELESEEDFIRQSLKKLRMEAETGELKALREFRKQLDAWRMAAATGLTDASDLSFASSMLETCVDRVRVLTGNALGFTLNFGLTLTEFLE